MKIVDIMEHPNNDWEATDDTGSWYSWRVVNGDIIGSVQYAMDDHDFKDNATIDDVTFQLDEYEIEALKAAMEAYKAK